MTVAEKQKQVELLLILKHGSLKDAWNARCDPLNFTSWSHEEIFVLHRYYSKVQREADKAYKLRMQ